MLIDSFLFFQEYDLLEIRLKYLYDHVDLFVIVESGQSYNGVKKKFNFDFHECYKTIQLLNSFYVSSEKKKTILVNKVIDSKKLGRKNEKISKIYR